MSAPLRILWAVNVPLPAATPALGLPSSPFGGWLSTMTQRLAQVPGVELGVVMRSPVEQLRRVDVGGICYFALPQVGKGGMDARPEDCVRVLEDFKPDLLHAEGSEMAYTRRLLHAFPGRKLLSLQGVINGYEPFELGGLRLGAMFASLRPRQLLPALALVLNKRLRFRPRLQGEREVVASVGHIMGRTPWDQAQAWALNPQARYHHCSRTLRAPFHQHRWSMQACERHTVFLGNAAAPRKGAHIALEAAALLRTQYPGMRIVFAGERPEVQRSRIKRLFGYSAYLQDRIHQLDLQDRVEFTGLLDAQQMAERMARAHVFAMASIIENSPNTLGEAMMLGMPCVSAFTGGTPGMAQADVEALFYRAEDAVGLAYQLKRLFDSDGLCVQLAEAAHVRAMKNHDPDANLQDLLRAYAVILGSEGDDAAA